MRSLLPKLLRRPEGFACLTPDRWDLVIRQARQAGILARLCIQLDDLRILKRVPEKPRGHLEAARTLAQKHARDVRWEVACLCRTLEHCDVPLTLLKGAAYLLADLPPARGRLFADLDILVPRSRIDEVEQILGAADWVSAVTDFYDQRYYRRWTHQIPPLRHIRRRSVLDVHHTIVPPTARAPVDAATLATESLPLSHGGRLHILQPADMVLHSAVHLFNDGEFDHGLRDLLDLFDLLSHFGSRPAFWETLALRAEALSLTRPLYLSLRYLDRILGMPQPCELREALLRWQPPAAAQAALDALFDRALLPDHASCDDYLTGTARWLLYVRAHYLRMPLHLLLPHLARKGFRRTAAADEKNDRRSRQAQIERLLRLAPSRSDDGSHAQAVRQRH